MAECKDSTINNTNTQKQSAVIGHNDSYEENKTDKVMEPLLIEDLKNGKVPGSFEKICSYMRENGVLLVTNDYIFLLIHVLMLECGFVTATSEEYLKSEHCGFNMSRVLNCVEKIASNWKKSERVRSGMYILPPFVQYPCKLTCTDCADDIIVNGAVQNIDCDNYSLLLDPSRHIISSTTKIDNKFQDIDHLSRIFKSSIGIPLKNAIMVYNDIPGLRLQDLPVEILFYIMQFLDAHSLGKLNKTCNFFKILGSDRVLWKNVPFKGFDSKKSEATNFRFMRVPYFTRYHHNRRLD